MDKATNHVLCGCNRLFHGRSFPFEVNSGGNEEVVLGQYIRYNSDALSVYILRIS